MTLRITMSFDSLTFSTLLNRRTIEQKRIEQKRISPRKEKAKLEVFIQKKLILSSVPSFVSKRESLQRYSFAPFIASSSSLSSINNAGSLLELLKLFINGALSFCPSNASSSSEASFGHPFGWKS